MNIISLATIKNKKSVSKDNRCLETAAYKNLFDLKEIKNIHINNDENEKLFYKVNKPFIFNKSEYIFFKDHYDDIFPHNNEIIMEKGHIYKFTAYNMSFNNQNKVNISQFGSEEIKQAINEHKEKILLEIIDLYDYIKDEMILYSEEFSSELGLKKSYIVLDSKEKVYELIKKNKIIMVQASDEVLQKALLTTRNDIKRKALIEKENWISLKGSGYKSFKLYTDAVTSYNKFKYENNYTGDLKELIINNKDKIKKVIPELTNREGNLIYERLGYFKNLYEDLNRNKEYYNILKETVDLKVKKYESLQNFNSQKIDDEVNNKIKTKALYIAKENIDEYVLSSIQKRIIKEYISNSDHRTSIMLKNGSEKVLDVLKNEYIKKLDITQLKNSIIKDEDLDNIYEHFYYFNNDDYKEELESILMDNFDFNKNNAELFINNVLNGDYYSCKDDDVISKSIKIIDNEGYFFITFNEFSDKLEDDLLICSTYKEIDFEKIKSSIEEYSLVFKLSDIKELRAKEDISKVFGGVNSLINLKEKLIKEDEDLTYMVPACEDILKDSNLIREVLNSQTFNIEYIEKIFESYKKRSGISNDAKFNDFFNIMLGKSFLTNEFLNKEKNTLENGEYQGLSIKVKYMSDEEYEDIFTQMSDIKSEKYKEFLNFLISKYYNTNLNDEEKRDYPIQLQNMFEKAIETFRFHKESGIIDPFLGEIIKYSKDNKKCNGIDVILGYSKKYKLHSISLEDDDNLELAHDIFRILTGAELKNGVLLGGSEIAINIKDCNSEIISFYINAICCNLQSEEEVNYINDLLKRYKVFENESIQKVNGRYKVVESLKEHYSTAHAIEYLCKFIDEIMMSSVNSKMKEAISEIKINNSGMMDICIVKNQQEYKRDGEAKLNYSSLKSINAAMYNFFKGLNIYNGKNFDFMSSVTERYLKDILRDRKFINSMEQSSNITIALASQYDASKYSNGREDKLINEKNIDSTKIKNITLNKATADKGYILQGEISNVFNDTIIYNGNEEKVNAYKINVKHMKLSNPLYKELFAKDINNKYIYENLFNGCTPEEYSAKKNIKPIISEIFIPAFKSKDIDNEENLKLRDLRRKSTDLINSLNILEKYNEYYNSSINGDYKENKFNSIKSLVDLKNNSENILKNYYKSLIYEAVNDCGYFKSSIEAEIDNSADLKIENITGYISESNEKYKADLFNESVNSHNFVVANYVNPKDMFKENCNEAYINIGKQLLTDNIDKSEEFYTYIKNNFVSNSKNSTDIKKYGKDLLKNQITLEKIGRNYLKKVGVNSIIFYDSDNTSERIKFTRTYVTNTVPKGVTYVDFGISEEYVSGQCKVFFEGIKKDRNNKYFLRNNSFIEDIYKKIESLDGCNHSTFENDYKESEVKKIKSCDLNTWKEEYFISKQSNDEDLKYEENFNIKNNIYKNISNKVFDYNYCLQEAKSSYIAKNEDTREAIKINRNIDKIADGLKLLLKDKYLEDHEYIKDQSRICDNYINNVNVLSNADNPLKDRTKALENIMCDLGSVLIKNDSKISLGLVFNDFNKIVNEEIFNNHIYVSSNERDKQPLFKKMEYCYTRLNADNYDGKGILEEVYSRKYGEDTIFLDNNEIKKGFKIYSINKDDAGLFEVINVYRNNNGDAELKIKDIKSKKLTIIQDKSFESISKKIHNYKIASQDKSNENILNFIKEKVKDEYICDFAESFEAVSMIFNKPIANSYDIQSEVLKDIRKEYDKDTVSDYVNIIQVLKNKNMISEDEIKSISKKIHRCLKKSEKVQNDYKQNLYSILKNNEKFKERNIDTPAKVKDFLSKVVTKENIEEIKNNEELNKVLKDNYYQKLNYDVNNNLVKKAKDTIIKAKSMDKDGIINNEDKIIIKKKLTKYVGNSYIGLINEKINEKKKQKRKEKNMYNNTSKLLKSSFLDVEKEALKKSNIYVIFNKQSIESYDYPIRNINIEPSVAPISADTNQVVNEFLDKDFKEHIDVPISDTRYYEQEKINSSINISAKVKSNSTNADLSQLIIKAVGGKRLNINMNYNDSRSMITQDEINGMIENSIK